MENELSLVPTRDMRINRALGQRVHLTDKAHLRLKMLIDHLTPQVSTIQQLKEHLLRHGYKTYVGRGIAFFHMQSKMSVKGSDIGRDYSLSLLENRIGDNATQNPELKRRKRKKRRSMGLHL
jgi:hypothetical protein